MFNNIQILLINFFFPNSIKYISLADLDNFVKNYEKSYESIVIYNNFYKIPENLSKFENIHNFIWNATEADIKHLGVLSKKTYEEMITPTPLHKIVHWPLEDNFVFEIDIFGLFPKDPGIREFLHLLKFTTWSHMYAVVYFFSEVFVHWGYRILFFYEFTGYNYAIGKIAWKIHKALRDFILSFMGWIEYKIIQIVDATWMFFFYFEIHLYVFINSLDEIIGTAIVFNLLANFFKEMNFWGQDLIKIKILLTYTENVIYVTSLHANTLLQEIGSRIFTFINEIPVDYINVPMDVFGVNEFFLISEKLEEILNIINTLDIENPELEKLIDIVLESKIEMREIELEDVDYKRCIVLVLKITASVTVGLAIYLLVDNDIVVDLIENLEVFLDE